MILSLIELLKAKQEDDEMVLQIVFVFQQILRNESNRDYMIKETGMRSLCNYPIIQVLPDFLYVCRISSIFN